MFKRVLLTVALIVPVAMVGLWMWGQSEVPASAQAPAEAGTLDASRTITVLGGGSVSVAPDIARVNMGVETSAETVSDAVAENRAKMDALLDALTEEGVASKDIQTAIPNLCFEWRRKRPANHCSDIAFPTWSR